MGNVVAHNVAVEGAAAKAAGMSEREFFEACKYDRAARGKIINKKIDIRDADIMTMLSNGEVTTDEFWSEFEKRTGVRVSTDYLGLFFNPVLDGAVVDIVKALRKKIPRRVRNEHDSKSLRYPPCPRRLCALR